MRWSWSGLVTLILAIAVGISLIITTWYAAKDVNDGRIIATMAGAMIGAISTYLGTRARKSDDDDK
jgi:hypothetical protein